LRRVCQAGRIDLIRDLATETAYRVSAELMGVPGPDGLTELALALPLAKRRIAEAPPDWLATLEGRLPDNPRLVTLQLWSALIFADVVGNVQMRRDLAGLALQAASEFFGHLDELIAGARAYSLGRPPTLVDAFIALTPEGNAQAIEQHVMDMRVLLAELSGSAIGIIPGVFGAVMEAVMDDRIDLARILPVLEGAPAHWPGPGEYPLTGVAQFIYETTRRKPSAQLLVRRCVKDWTLPSGAQIKAGEWVGALVAAAGLDPRAFPDPWMFSLYPWIKGPPRSPDKFLLFGAHGGDRQCWGRDRLALEIVSQCVRAAGKLPGLRRIAGPGRGFEIFAGSRIGLRGRFAAFRYSGGL
jgi:cytochrome P450